MRRKRKPNQGISSIRGINLRTKIAVGFSIPILMVIIISMMNYINLQSLIKRSDHAFRLHRAWATTSEMAARLSDNGETERIPLANRVAELTKLLKPIPAFTEPLTRIRNRVEGLDAGTDKPLREEVRDLLAELKGRAADVRTQLANHQEQSLRITVTAALTAVLLGVTLAVFVAKSVAAQGDERR